MKKPDPAKPDPAKPEPRPSGSGLENCSAYGFKTRKITLGPLGDPRGSGFLFLVFCGVLRFLTGGALFSLEGLEPPTRGL